jgi:mevalonate kinase
MISASAPGKIILFGEHAVVHGQPAIAVPLSAVQVTVTAEIVAPGGGLTIHAPDVGAALQLSSGSSVFAYTPDAETPYTAHYDALVYPIQVALEALHSTLPDMILTVRSTIPIASGLGSGAALAAAMIRAVAFAVGHPIDNDTLNPLVYEVEKHHHGTPSGIDNTVIVYQTPVYFVRDQPIETFRIAHPFTVIVADTGHASPTKIAVSDVRQLYEREPGRIGAIFARIGAITRAARAIIESATIESTESLGPLMDENHALLCDLTVSSPDLDRLCAAARASGALGAKLSGAGRGGNMIALVTPEHARSVSEALRAAGAVRIIQTTVKC